MVIDPAAEIEKISETLNLLEVELKYIYITHCHADHIGALEELKRKTNAKVLIHRKEAENLRNPEVNLSGLLGIKNIGIEADSRVDDSDIFHVRRFKV